MRYSTIRPNPLFPTRLFIRRAKCPVLQVMGNIHAGGGSADSDHQFIDSLNHLIESPKVTLVEV